MTDDVNGDAISDLAIVDTHVDRFNPSPTVRILLGAAGGRFKPSRGVDVVSLGEGETPIALAFGRFRNPETVDLAVVSTPATPGTSSRGLVRILFNNGSGDFSAGSTPPISLGDFEPSAMAAGVFRRDGKVDLVIKEALSTSAGRKRLLYLQNAGNATFPLRQAIEGAGDVAAVVLGPLQTRDASGAVADVITFDRDMTLRIFASDGQGHLNPLPPLNDGSRFAFIGQPQFFAIRNDSGPLQLMAAAARVSNPGAHGMLLLTSDESGHFEDPQFRAFRRITMPSQSGTTKLEPVFGQPQFEAKKRSMVVGLGVVAPFLNAQLGNQKPDFAFIANDIESELRSGTCGGDEGSRVPPGSTSKGGLAGLGMCTNPRPACEDGLVFCKARPVGGKCVCTCDQPAPDAPVKELGCHVTTRFPPVLIVAGNPFDK